MPTPTARYDGIADWYDTDFLPGAAATLGRSIAGLLADLTGLAGTGTGRALDIGCGTGHWAGVIRRLGYRPVGLDLSADQLRIAAGRLPVARADAARLPVRDSAVDLAYTVMTSTDIDDLAGATREAFRVLRPGGRFVHVGVHPCFLGGHAEVRPDETIVQHPGYLTTAFHPHPPHRHGLQAIVGGWQRPLAEVVNAHLDAGFHLTRLVEGGPDQLPWLLGLTLRKPAS